MGNILTLEERLKKKAANYKEDTFIPILKNLQANILKHHSKKYALYTFITFRKEIANKEALATWLENISKTLTNSYQKLRERENESLIKISLKRTIKQYKQLSNRLERFENLLSSAVELFGKLSDIIPHFQELIDSESSTLSDFRNAIEKIDDELNELEEISVDFFELIDQTYPIERRNGVLLKLVQRFETQIKEAEGNDLEELKARKKDIENAINLVGDLHIKESKKKVKAWRSKRVKFLKFVEKLEQSSDLKIEVVKEEFQKIISVLNGVNTLIDFITQTIKNIKYKNTINLDHVKKEFKAYKEKIAFSEVNCFYLSYEGYEYFGKKGNQIPGNYNDAFRLGLKETKFYKENKKTVEEEFDREIHVLLIKAGIKKGVTEENEIKKRIISDLGGKENGLFEHIHFEFGSLSTPSNNDNSITGWFNFKDGISNPRFFPNKESRALPHFQAPCKLGLVLTPCIGGPPFSCGSFATFMKFQQNKEAFEETTKAIIRKVFNIKETIDQDKLSYAGALLLGRHEDGTPLTLSPKPNPDTYPKDFDYSRDPDGSNCPMHAHIRKANPRNGNGYQRIVRRGMFYGKRSDTPEKGLLFMSFQSDLESQFEYILDKRLHNNYYQGEKIGSDPIINNNSKYRKYKKVWGSKNGETFTIPSKRLTIFRGGFYLFCPSLSSILNLKTSLLM